MQKEQIPLHQKLFYKHYLANFNGPILFTAPHSKKLMRGGQIYGIPQQVHHRQKYAGFIVMKLAQATKDASFITWGKQKSEGDPDPNYIKQQQLQKSVFHQCLHKWALINKEKPLFHIDIHGKSNSSKSCQIQVGTKAMKRVYKKSSIVTDVVNYFDSQFKQAFSGYDFNGKKCMFNSVNPHFGGSWGHQILTMADQSARMGIPSIQLEIPAQVRLKLFEDEQFFKIFHNCLVRVYNQVIVSNQKLLNEPKIDKQMAQKCEQTICQFQITQCLANQSEFQESKKDK